MIRLVVSDVDGTLIGKDEVLPQAALSLVNKLEAKGVKFSLATGRVECMASKFVEKLGVRIPYVACNGATVVGRDRVIRRLQVPVAPLRSFIEKADSYGLSIIYSIEGREFIWGDAPYILSQRAMFDRYHDEHRFSETEWENLMIDKLSIMSDRDDDTIARLEALCNGLGDEFGYTRYMDRSIEIVHRDATKANGVKTLAAMLGIPMENVLFVGDHQNDIELIKAAGVGAAVGNSTPDVMACADYVCSKPLFDGVMEAVTRFVFEAQG
jgi:HAD-superfamily hydrolase, subfamily IIB